MKTHNDNDLIHEIEERLNIVDIVSETVSLTRKGNRYWGLCPFHQEKTPSFSVTPDKNMFYCFGCHAGGDIFSFVMKRDGVDFKEALQILADKAGLQVVKSAPGKSDRYREIAELNKAAAEYFQKALYTTRAKAARDYLSQRGITEETMQAFGLGYAPDSWNNIQEYLLKKGFPSEILKDSGLIKRSEKSDRYYDLFRNRIIFPIHRYTGEIIGFGGRVLDDSLPKYLNTPETDLFAKRRNLYAIYQARDVVRKANEVILVEGYMDCIKLHQLGIKNVVASLGTAFTNEQAQLISRYAETVVILFDGDEAGQRETMKAGEILAHEGLDVSVVSLPGGKDPDEYVDIFGKEDFLHYVQNNRTNYIEFKINRYIRQSGVLSVENKAKIIDQVRDDIKCLNSEIKKDYFIKILAQKLKTEEIVIRRELIKKNRRNEGINRNKTITIRDNIQCGNYSIEEKIMAAMLTDRDIFYQIKNSLGFDVFSKGDYIRLLELSESIADPGENWEFLRKVVIEEGLDDILAKLSLLIEEGIQANRMEIESFVLQQKRFKWELNWKELYVDLQHADDKGDFYKMLSFLLKIDSFINKEQEGGIM